MAAGMRAVLEVADVIDIVVEVRDARLPRSTAVAHLHRRLAHKPQIAVLNRYDLAEEGATAAWIQALRAGGLAAFACVGTRAGTLRALRADLLARPRKRGRLRIAVVGAPNTGKSSFINALSRTKRAIAQDRPGVTRHVRWLDLEPGVQLLDTPGLLAPRILAADAAWQLALCGSLPETAHDVEETVTHFHRWLKVHRPQLASKADLEAFASVRGMRRRGGEIDRVNAARKLVALFRAGELFRITFERPDDGE
jgi:ribosome biogenesis GTPase A